VNPPLEQNEQGVLITNKDIYFELLQVKDKVNAMTPQSETIADHEKRLRRVERWMWALPAALITAIGSVGVAYLETHR
jgi:hypothetical protein